MTTHETHSQPSDQTPRGSTDEAASVPGLNRQVVEYLQDKGCDTKSIQMAAIVAAEIDRTGEMPRERFEALLGEHSYSLMFIGDLVEPLVQMRVEGKNQAVKSQVVQICSLAE